MFAKIAESKWMKFVLFITTFAFVGTAFVAIVIYKFAGNITGAAVVNGREISLQEFYYQVNVIQSRLENEGVDTAPLKKEIYDQALEAVIDRELLFQEAEKEGVIATDEEVKKAILDIDVFKDGDKFSKDRYIALLTGMNISPQLFEEIVRKDLSAQHLFTFLNASFYITEEEIDSYINKQLSKVSGDFLYIKPEPLKISEEEAKKYYEKHKNEYTGKEGKEVIIYRIDIDKSNQEKSEKLAKDLFLKLKKGETDIKNKEIKIVFRDVVYDSINISNIPQELKEKLKEISQDKKIIFVKTDDAYYLSKFIKSVKEPLPYEKVKEKIYAKLEEEYEKKSVKNLYEKISQEKEKDIQNLKKKYKGELENIEDETVRDIIVRYGLTPEYMKLFIKEKQGIIPLKDGILVYSINKVTPPTAEESEELRKLVEPLLRNEKYNTLVQMYLDRLRKEADIVRNERIFR
ncbi:peptidylprolyl isomerase [Persephonella sp.]